MPRVATPPISRTIFWIDVEDHLPDDEITVLCCCETEVFLGYHLAGRWIDSASDEPITVTHWADLPDPA